MIKMTLGTLALATIMADLRGGPDLIPQKFEHIFELS